MVRAITAVSVLCACTLACWGCGRQARTAASLPAAAAHTLDALPYRFDLTVEFRENGRKVVGHGHGAGDDETMAETVHYPPMSPGEKVGTTSRYLLDEREGRLDTYVDNPAPEMAGGKHWLKFDLLPRFRRYGLEPSMVPGADLRSPARFFHALQRFHGMVRRLGVETIGSTETTHYRVRLDENDVVRSAPPEKREAVRQLLGREHVRLDADVWVDESGLITRLREAARNRDLTIQTLTFHDWGKPFTLRLPPPEDVADGNKLGR